jgi:hypothetical protein
MFFSEEKNQKTFASGARGSIPPHVCSIGASIVGAAEEHTSFCSFLQKRTYVLFSARSGVAHSNMRIRLLRKNLCF